MDAKNRDAEDRLPDRAPENGVCRLDANRQAAFRGGMRAAQTRKPGAARPVGRAASGCFGGAVYNPGLALT
jgi:hypothetical protein